MLRRELAALLIAAIVIRCLGWFALDYQLTGDARSYQALATNLSEHGTLSLSTTEPWLPTALRPPLYPALVAAVQSAWPGLTGVQLVQLVLSVASALLLGWVARRRLGGPEGRAAAWALALNPFDGPFVAAMLTETLSTFLVAATISSLALMRTSRRFLVAGAFAGLAALTRDLFLVLPVALACLLVARSFKAPRRGVRRAVLVLAGAACVIGPWTGRNLLQFGRVIPVASGGLEYNAWIGTWERTPDWIAGGVIVYPDEAFPTPEHRTRLEAMGGELYDEAARALLKEMAMLNWRREPLSVALRCLRRAPLTWLGTRSEIFRYGVPGLNERGSLPWKLTKAAQWGLNALIIGMGLGFLVFGWRGRPRWRWLRWLAVGPPLVTAAAYLPMHSAESRYSQPVLQLFVLTGAVSATWLFRRVRRRLPGGTY